MGTVPEDATSLAAVNELGDLAVRQIACVGLGAEQDNPAPRTFSSIPPDEPGVGCSRRVRCVRTPSLSADYGFGVSRKAWV